MTERLVFKPLKVHSIHPDVSSPRFNSAEFVYYRVRKYFPNYISVLMTLRFDLIAAYKCGNLRSAKSLS